MKTILAAIILIAASAANAQDLYIVRSAHYIGETDAVQRDTPMQPGAVGCDLESAQFRTCLASHARELVRQGEPEAKHVVFQGDTVILTP